MLLREYMQPVPFLGTNVKNACAFLNIMHWPLEIGKNPRKRKLKGRFSILCLL